MADAPRFELHMDFDSMSKAAAAKYVKTRRKMTHLVVSEEAEAAYLSGHMAVLMSSTTAYVMRGLATIFAAYANRLPPEVSREELIDALGEGMSEFASLLESYDYTKL